MKKRLLGVLLVGALALTPSISAFAAIDESQESEKLKNDRERKKAVQGLFFHFQTIHEFLHF